MKWKERSGKREKGVRLIKIVSKRIDCERE